MYYSQHVLVTGCNFVKFKVETRAQIMKSESELNIPAEKFN